MFMKKSIKDIKGVELTAKQMKDLKGGERPGCLGAQGQGQCIDHVCYWPGGYPGGHCVAL
jgi:hypothetical protein